MGNQYTTIPYEPTADEITRGCLKIQMKWDEKMRLGRLGIGNRQVREILSFRSIRFPIVSVELDWKEDT